MRALSPSSGRARLRTGHTRQAGKTRQALLLAAAAAAALGAPHRASAQTWNGAGPGWNTASAWSEGVVPNSPVAAVSFPAVFPFYAVNISSSVSAQSLSFSNTTLGYSITSSPGVSLSGVSAINVAANVTAAQTINLANIAAGSLLFPSGNLTITNDSIAAGTTLAIGPNTVIGTPGFGGVYVNGAGTTQISGSFATGSTSVLGGLTMNGPGTLILSNPASTYAGGTFVNGGTLRLGAGSAIPTGSNVTVSGGGEFNTNGLGNTAAKAIGTLALDSGGTFRVSSGAGASDYYLKQLATTGGTIDLSGASNYWLHFTGSGAGITTNGGINTWIGPAGAATSRILNETFAPLVITVNPGLDPYAINLEAGITLSAGAGTSPFVKAGFGTMRLTSLANTADISIQSGSLRVDDLSTNGVGALGSGAIRLTGGKLVYGGPSATTSKNMTLELTSSIQVATPGANLTYSGLIVTLLEALNNPSFQRTLVVLGPGPGSPPSTVTLAATNNYHFTTSVRDNAIVSIPSIKNIGEQGPIGADSNHLGIQLGTADSRGTLLLTGTDATYTTNRNVVLEGSYPNGGVIGVQNAATTLIWNGTIYPFGDPIHVRFSGNGALIKTGAGTLKLTHITKPYTIFDNPNIYTGGTYVESGTLAVAGNAAIPEYTNVTVLPGATFLIDFVGGNDDARLGKVTLDAGTLRVAPSAANDYRYYVNQLDMTGGTVDFTGAADFWLHIAGNGGAPAAITTNASFATATWIGSGTSRIQNIAATPATITVAAGTAPSGIDLDAGIILGSGGGFVKTGAGTMRLTNPANAANLVVQQGVLRVDDVTTGGVGALGSGTLTLDGGRLAYGGANATLSKPFTVTAGGTLDVLNAATTLTLTSPIITQGLLTKSGPGVLVLNNLANLYGGGIAVSGGRLDVGSDAQLGIAAVTVNPFGTLRYTASTTTAARTFTLNSGALEVAAGATVTMNGASVGGGFLRGAGIYALTGGTALTGATTLTTTTINVTGPASVTNFTNDGNVTVAAGQTLGWNGGTNTPAGRLTVNGTANVNDFVSNGTLTVNRGGTINTGSSPMVLGGGSTTSLGSSGSPGGTINLGGQNLELRGALLTNFGAIAGGATHVYFGSLLAGTGTFGTVVMHAGSTFTPGFTLSNAPATTAGSGIIQPLDPNQSTVASVVLEADTLTTVVVSDGSLTLTGPMTSITGKKLTKAGGGTLALAALRAGGLAVQDGTVKILPNGSASGTTSVNTLAITAPAGRFDLTNNKLVVFGGDVAAVSALIASGRNGGNWSGSGIVTSFASGNFTTLGVATAQQTGRAGGTFGGIPVAANDTLVMFTYGGDANLDGKINVDDYGRIDFNIALGTSGWFNGDFNYDGKINVDDYGIIDFNIGIQGAPFSTTTSVAQGLSAARVPEAIFPLPCALAFARLFRRQRRRLVVA